MKIGYLCYRNTTAYYYPFFLLKRREIRANLLDANLIRVAPEYHDTGGLACLYHYTIG
jgi:hypothetical protein